MFFLSRHRSNAANPIWGLTGLIFLLTGRISPLLKRLQRYVAERSNDMLQGSSSLHPLWKLLTYLLDDEAVPNPLYLMIDALDECLEVGELLQLISHPDLTEALKHTGFCPVGLRQPSCSSSTTRLFVLISGRMQLMWDAL